MDNRHTQPVRSREDLLVMIARTQGKIIESLNTLDVEASRIENADLIRQELEHLRDLLGALWFSYSAAMAMPRHKTTASQTNPEPSGDNNPANPATAVNRGRRFGVPPLRANTTSHPDSTSFPHARALDLSQVAQHARPEALEVGSAATTIDKSSVGASP